MHEKPKFSIYFFIAIASSLFLGFVMVNIMRVNEYTQSYLPNHRFAFNAFNAGFKEERSWNFEAFATVKTL